MVYLVRTIRFLKYDEGLEEASNKLFAHIRKSYPQIKDMKLLSNVTGPIDEMHWVLEFDSLAKEDEWAARIMQDDLYLNWFKEAEGKATPGFDRLYRDVPMMG
jgi:hypothetical protein